MHPLVRLLLTVLVLTVGACARMEIRSSHDPAAEFSALRTYAWVPDPNRLSLHPRVRSAELDEHIKAAVDRELSRKGYEKTVAQEPDFLVRYLGSIRHKIGSKTVWEPNPGLTDPESIRWGDIGFTQTYTTDYRQGSLVINIFKPGTKNPVWSGVAEAVLDESAPREKRRGRLDTAINRILEKFPSQ